MIIIEFAKLSLFSLQQAHENRLAPPVMNLNQMVIRPMFFNTGVIVLFILPAISMRLLAEEKKSNTIEFLLTSPVSTTELLLGKYFAGLSLYCIMVAFTGLYQLILLTLGHLDTAPIVCGYIGLFFLGAAYMSLGIFFSSLTENQIIASIMSLVTFLFLWVIGWAAGVSGEKLGNLLSQLSFNTHFENFAKGVIDTRSIVFFLSVTTIGLFLSHCSLSSLRWGR
jgi:ABC-2 type transport system permease protein